MRLPPRPIRGSASARALPTTAFLPRSGRAAGALWQAASRPCAMTAAASPAAAAAVGSLALEVSGWEEAMERDGTATTHQRRCRNLSHTRGHLDLLSIVHGQAEEGAVRAAGTHPTLTRGALST